MKIGFQGVKGAYSEVALHSFFQDQSFEAIGYNLSEQVCEALDKNEIAFAILPVENSLIGNVTHNWDLIYRYNFNISIEVLQPINHCLLGQPNSKLEDITHVRSHSVALEQCRDFTTKHSIKSIPDYDTAGSAKHLKDNPHIGAIASELCSKYYNLKIINKDIQNYKKTTHAFLLFLKKKKQFLKKKKALKKVLH